MENLYFKNTSQIQHFLVDKPIIGSGTEGICYKIDDFVLKIYSTNLSQNINSNYDASYYLQFKDINIESFNFIKNVAYLDNLNTNQLVGTISKYIEGASLDYDTLYNLPIDTIILELKRLLPDIASLSKNGIKVGHIVINNIIYNKGKFTFIDTASYNYSSEEPYYTYKNNVLTIMEELMFGIIGIDNNKLIFEYLNRINKNYNYIIDNELLFNPIKLILNLKKSLEEYCDQELLCFSDSKEILTKKLKRN